MIKGSKKYNLRYNCEQVQSPPFGKYISGQGKGLVSKLRYGLCHMSFNGCEVIAVHNALVYLGKPVKLTDIAFYMERFRVFMGIFGCNAYSLGRALSHFGADAQRSRSAAGSKAFIVTYWTKRPFLSSIHTVFCIREKNGIRVYNRYNSCTTSQLCKSDEEVYKNRKPIAVYTIEQL